MTRTSRDSGLPVRYPLRDRHGDGARLKRGLFTVVHVTAQVIEALWTEVCVLRDLEPFWGEAALVDDEQVALFLLPGGLLYAVSNRCPVSGAQVMSRGIVGSKGDRHTIASPLHKQVYDLETGECLSAEGEPLGTHAVRVVDGLVQILIEPRPGG